MVRLSRGLRQGAGQPSPTERRSCACSRSAPRTCSSCGRPCCRSTSGGSAKGSPSPPCSSAQRTREPGSGPARSSPAARAPVEPCGKVTGNLRTLRSVSTPTCGSFVTTRPSRETNDPPNQRRPGRPSPQRLRHCSGRLLPSRRRRSFASSALTGSVPATAREADSFKRETRAPHRATATLETGGGTQARGDRHRKRGATTRASHGQCDRNVPP
jgi:hypothetical protein